MVFDVYHYGRWLDRASAYLGKPFDPNDTRMAAELRALYDQGRKPESVLTIGMVSVQEAWEACGGQPDIPATKEELLAALKAMNEAEDEVEEKGLTIEDVYLALGVVGPRPATKVEAITQLAGIGGVIAKQFGKARDAEAQLAIDDVWFALKLDSKGYSRPDNRITAVKMLRMYASKLDVLIDEARD